MSTSNPSSRTSPERGPQEAHRGVTKILAVVTVALLVVSLYPPYFGSIALVAAVGTGLATQARSGLAIPKRARYATAVALGVTLVVVVVATVTYFTTPTYENPATAPSDDGSVWAFLAFASLFAAYEIAVVVTLVAAVRYTRQLTRISSTG